MMRYCTQTMAIPTLTRFKTNKPIAAHRRFDRRRPTDLLVRQASPRHTTRGLFSTYRQTVRISTVLTVL